MELRQLRYFIAVAEQLSFTEAAKRLYHSQSSISHQIADLETTLGVKLFVRDKHSVSLTSAGKTLLFEAHALIAKTEEAVQKTRQSACGSMGTLNIGFLSLSVVRVMPQLLGTFRASYPKIEIKLDQMNPGQISEGLEQEELDLGFTRSISRSRSSGLTWRRLYVEKVCAAVHETHHFAKETTISLSELSRESFVSINRAQSPGLFDLTLRLCSSRGFSPNILSRHQHMETVLCLVEAGIGISILPRSFEQIASRSVRFIDIAGKDASVDLCIVWNERKENPSIQLFLQTVNEYFPLMNAPSAN